MIKINPMSCHIRKLNRSDNDYNFPFLYKLAYQFILFLVFVSICTFCSSVSIFCNATLKYIHHNSFLVLIVIEKK